MSAVEQDKSQEQSTPGKRFDLFRLPVELRVQVINKMRPPSLFNFRRCSSECDELVRGSRHMFHLEFKEEVAVLFFLPGPKLGVRKTGFLRPGVGSGPSRMTELEWVDRWNVLGVWYIHQLFIKDMSIEEVREFVIPFIKKLRCHVDELIVVRPDLFGYGNVVEVARSCEARGLCMQTDSYRQVIDPVFLQAWRKGECMFTNMNISYDDECRIPGVIESWFLKYAPHRKMWDWGMHRNSVLRHFPKDEMKDDLVAIHAVGRRHPKRIAYDGGFVIIMKHGIIFKGGMGSRNEFLANLLYKVSRGKGNPTIVQWYMSVTDEREIPWVDL